MNPNWWLVVALQSPSHQQQTAVQSDAYRFATWMHAAEVDIGVAEVYWRSLQIITGKIVNGSRQWGR
jgi:hypothetical protein